MPHKVPEHDADRQISNWFMAAKRRSPLFERMLHALVRYLFRPRARPLTTMAVYKLVTDWGVAPELVGATTTGAAAIAALEARHVFPYFLFHYLFNQARPEHAPHMPRARHAPSPRIRALLCCCRCSSIAPSCALTGGSCGSSTRIGRRSFPT